jgi:hypothetical protein
MNRILGLVAGVGFVLAAYVHALTFYPGRSIVTDGGASIWLLHIGMFAVFAPMVLAMRQLFGAQASWQSQMSLFPPWARIALGVAMIYTLFNFAFFVSTTEGEPEIRSRDFALMSHGRFIRSLSQDEYFALKRRMVRGFSGHWLLFYLAPTLFFLTARAPLPRRRSDDGRGGGSA